MDENRVMHAMSVDDAYHVERVLARGAGGITELVSLDGSGPFVRKKMPRDEANRAVWALCASCDCSRLPRVEATYELPDEFVVVYDFVPGDSVERIIGSRGPFPPERAVSLARDVCEAAGALHACGVIHRDISPNNVIVSKDGAHLIDLGIARVLDGSAAHDDDTRGTWGFAAPEQYGFAPTDARSDVYSIGRLFAYLLTGIPPSDDGFDAALADPDKVPAGLAAVITKATAFEPSMRYQSARELSCALTSPKVESPALPETSDDTRTNSPESAKKGRHRLPLAVLGIVAAGVILVCAGSLVAGRDTSGTDSQPSASESTSGGSTTNSAGLSTSGGAAAQPASETDVLEVDSLEWGLAERDTVIYLVGLTNTSEALSADLAGVSITGYDAEGQVTFSNTLYYDILRPGETLCLADIATDAGETVDVQAQVVETAGRLAAWDGDTGHAFEASGVSYARNGSGTSKLTGTITALSDDGVDCPMVRVDIVLRDGDGNLTGYGCAYPQSPDVGAKTSFESVAIVDSDDVASYEVYVSPWG